MKTFSPVHCHAMCKLSLSFGPEERSPLSFGKDVVELLVNRCATNALVLAAGCRDPVHLDQQLGELLLAADPNLDPVRYFSRLAKGSPAIRRNGAKGRPVEALSSYLGLLDSSSREAFWMTANWSLWKYIHPTPVSAADLVFTVGPEASPGSGAILRLATIDCPLEQAGAILETMRSGPLPEALTALWSALRQSVRFGDLRRYACLYDAWLQSRPALAQSPIFLPCVDQLYAFTATWFGQVEVRVDDDMFPPIHRADYLRCAADTIAELRGSAARPEIGSTEVWGPFLINASQQPPGLLVRLRGDVPAFSRQLSTCVRQEPSSSRGGKTSVAFPLPDPPPVPDQPRSRTLAELWR